MGSFVIIDTAACIPFHTSEKKLNNIKERDMKTLIAFATKGGVTAESARVIAEVLETQFGHEVEVVDLKENKSPDISPYNNIFIRSGIRIGRWYGRAKKMLKNDFRDKKVVLYLSACSAGDPEKHDEAVIKYMTAKLEKYPHLGIVAAEAFGGRMKMSGKNQVDTYDPEKVKAWAEEVGKMLK
jgi:menaquinone-dependent protoporphyrinogen IX oxidase